MGNEVTFNLMMKWLVSAIAASSNNQLNRLAGKLSELDDGILALKEGLGKEWDNTAVVIGTEFGRTAKENGTSGTDHGTASSLMLAGGAISGGRVIGEWPGLTNKELYKERDLMPTSSTFGWLATLLAQHWGLNNSQLAQVFPGIKPYNVKLV